MPAYSIAVDLSDLIPPNAPLNAETFPALAAAVQRMGMFAHERWLDYAMGKPLPSGLVVRNRTGEYARSIRTRETGPFSVDVFSELPYARLIEEGTPSHDMKKMLNSSLKVRLTKDGKRYLIIPFFHDRHSGMPDDVKDFFAGKKTTHITGTFRRQSGTGAYDIKTRKLITVPGWRYAWGDRLGKRDLAQMGIHGLRARRLEGIYKFQNPGGAAGGGAPKGSHTQYISFRKMVEGSKGWIAKAQPGKYPARTVANEVRPLAVELFRAALEEDVKALVQGG